MSASHTRPPGAPGPSGGPESPDHRHVVLVGFMGSGKTVVGRALAERIGCEFIDLDDAIAEAAGSSLREVFRRHGEVGFRARERATLREVLSRRQSLIIATGASTFADPTMRDWIQQAGRSVYLQASPETLLARINQNDGRQQRPVLGGPDPEQTLRRLLAERTESYEQCDHIVRTDLTRIEGVADEIARLLRLERRAGVTRAPAARRRIERAVGPPGEGEAGDAGGHPVQVRLPNGHYPVFLRAGAGSWISHEIVRHTSGTRIAVIADETVAAIHATPLVAQLRDAGRTVSLHVVPPGEEAKSLATAGLLYGRLLEAGIERGDALVALGGGVIADLAGFVASTYLRGLPYVQVPTTTIAAVDATIGGRTALHTAQAPDLIGTHYPPRAVLISIAHLGTQPRRAHAAGLIETLRLAATLDATLFDTLTREAGRVLACEPDPTLAVLRRAVALKAEILGGQEQTNGERTVLTFGHTLGTAIEHAEGARLLHGEAVGLGMVAESEWAESEGLCSQVSAPLSAALRALGAPVDWRGRAMDEHAVGGEHKRRGTNLRLAYLPRIGSHELRSVPIAALVEFVRRRRAP